MSHIHGSEQADERILLKLRTFLRSSTESDRATISQCLAERKVSRVFDELNNPAHLLRAIDYKEASKSFRRIFLKEDNAATGN